VDVYEDGVEDYRTALTLMTTAVTVLSAQKKVLERRAYCSENLRMTSTDLSDLSLEASAPAAAHNRYHISQFIPIAVRGGQKLESSTNLGDRRERTLSSDGASAGASSGHRRRRRADGEPPAPNGGGDGGCHHRPVPARRSGVGGGWAEGNGARGAGE